MIVAVSILQLLRGDKTALENVINDRLRTLGSDGLAQLDEFRRQLWLAHRLASSRANCSAVLRG